MNAALGGASLVFSVDQDADAIALARENFTRNGLEASKHDFLAADAFELLESFKRERRQFDVIILDPPAFAKSQKAVDSAIAGYALAQPAGARGAQAGGGLLARRAAQPGRPQRLFRRREAPSTQGST